MTELTTAQQTGLVLPTDWTDPMEESALIQQTIGSATPFLKIAYVGSTNQPPNIYPGQLFVSTTGEIFPNGIELMLVEARPGQRWFEGAYAEGRAASCFSIGGIHPDGRGQNPQPGPCRVYNEQGVASIVCPKAEWDRSVEPNRPPACSTVWTTVLWDLTSHRGLVMQFYNTSEPTLRYMLRQIAQRANILSPEKDANGKHKIPPRFRARFLLTTKKEGTYHVPQVEFLWSQPVPDEEIRMMMGELQWLNKEEWARLQTPKLPQQEKDDLPF